MGPIALTIPLISMLLSHQFLISHAICRHMTTCITITLLCLLRMKISTFDLLLLIYLHLLWLVFYFYAYFTCKPFVLFQLASKVLSNNNMIRLLKFIINILSKDKASSWQMILENLNYKVALQKLHDFTRMHKNIIVNKQREILSLK